MQWSSLPFSPPARDNQPPAHSPEGPRGGFPEAWQFCRALFFLPPAPHPLSPNLSCHSWDPPACLDGPGPGPSLSPRHHALSIMAKVSLTELV